MGRGRKPARELRLLVPKPVGRGCGLRAQPDPELWPLCSHPGWGTALSMGLRPQCEGETPVRLPWLSPQPLKDSGAPSLQPN